MKHLTASTLSIITLATMALAPVAAFADDSVTVSADANASAQTGRSDRPEGKGPGIPGLNALRAHLNGGVQGSTTIEHPNRPDPANRPEPGVRPERPEQRMASTSRDGKEPKQMNEANAKERASKEIETRIQSLNQFSARIAAMVRLGGADKTTLSAAITDQIAQLTALKAKIDAETGTTTLKADVESITKSQRVYLLVIPKAAITAAADRVLAIATQFDTYATKLQERITAAQTAGVDVTASAAALVDLKAKNADAKVQAQAAASAVANLAPDNGVQSVKEANTAVLKAAKAKIDAAEADLKAARADAATILKAVAGKDAKVKAESSTETH